MSLVVNVKDKILPRESSVCYGEYSGVGFSRNTMDVPPIPRISSRWRTTDSRNRHRSPAKRNLRKTLLKMREPLVPKVLKFFQMIMTLTTILLVACSNWMIPGGDLLYKVFISTCIVNLLILVTFVATNSYISYTNQDPRFKKMLRKAEFCYYVIAVISLLIVTASVYKISYNLSLRICSLFGAVLVILHVVQFVFVFSKDVKQLTSLVRNRLIPSSSKQSNEDQEKNESRIMLNNLLWDHFPANSSYTEISESTFPVDTKEVSLQQMPDKRLPNNTYAQLYTTNECVFKNEIEPITSVEVCTTNELVIGDQVEPITSVEICTTNELVIDDDIEPNISVEVNNAKSKHSWRVHTTCILNDEYESITSGGISSAKCIPTDEMKFSTSEGATSGTYALSDKVGVINEVKTKTKAATKPPPQEQTHNTKRNQNNHAESLIADQTLKKVKEKAPFPMHMGDSPAKLVCNQQPIIPNPEMITQELVDELIEADPLTVLKALEEVAPKKYSSLVNDGLHHGDIESSLTARHVLMLYQTIKEVPLEQLAMAIRRSNNNQYLKMFWSCMIKQRQRCRLENELETAAQDLIVNVVNKMGKVYALQCLIQTHPGKVARIMHDFPPEVVEDVLNRSSKSTLGLAAEYVSMPALNAEIRSIPFDYLVDVFKLKSSAKLDLACRLRTLSKLCSTLSKVSLQNMSDQRANDLVSILVDTCPQSFLHTMNLVSPQATFQVLRSSNVNIQLADLDKFDLFSAAIEDTATNELKRAMSSLSTNLKINTLRNTPIHLVWNAMRCYSAESLALIDDMDDDFEAYTSVDDTTDISANPSTEKESVGITQPTFPSKSNETIVLDAKGSPKFEDDDVVDPSDNNALYSPAVVSKQTSSSVSLAYQKMKTMEKVPTFTTLVMERIPPSPTTEMLDEVIGDSYQQPRHQENSVETSKKSHLNRKEVNQATVIASLQDADDQLPGDDITNTSGDPMLESNEVQVKYCDDISTGPNFTFHNSTSDLQDLVVDGETSVHSPTPNDTLSRISFGTFCSEDFVLRNDKSDEFDGGDGKSVQCLELSSEPEDAIDEGIYQNVEQLPNPVAQQRHQAPRTSAISLLKYLTKQDRQAMRVCFPAPNDDQTEIWCNTEDEVGDFEKEIEHINTDDKRYNDKNTSDRISAAPRKLFKGSYSSISSFISCENPRRDKYNNSQMSWDEQKRVKRRATKKARAATSRHSNLPQNIRKQERRKEEKENVSKEERLHAKHTTNEDFSGDQADTNRRPQDEWYPRFTEHIEPNVSQTTKFKMCNSITGLPYNIHGYKRKQKSSNFEKYSVRNKNTSSSSSNQTHEYDVTNQTSNSCSSGDDDYMSTIDSTNLDISTSFIHNALSRHSADKTLDKTTTSSSSNDKSKVRHTVKSYQEIQSLIRRRNKAPPADMLHKSLKTNNKSIPKGAKSSVGYRRKTSTVKVNVVNKEQKSSGQEAMHNKQLLTVLGLLEYLGLDPSQMRNFEDLETSLYNLDLTSVKTKTNTTRTQEELEELQLNVEDLKKIFEDAYQFFLETRNNVEDSHNPYEPKGREKEERIGNRSSTPECSHKQSDGEVLAGLDTVFDDSGNFTLDDFILKLNTEQLQTETCNNNNNSNHEWDLLNELYPPSASSSAGDYDDVVQPTSTYPLRLTCDLYTTATGDDGILTSDLSMGAFILP